MEKYAILLGYFDKQLVFVKKLYDEVIPIDLSIFRQDKSFPSLHPPCL